MWTGLWKHRAGTSYNVIKSSSDAIDEPSRSCRVSPALCIICTFIVILSAVVVFAPNVSNLEDVSASIQMIQRGLRPCGSIRPGLRSDGLNVTLTSDCPPPWHNTQEVLDHISKLRITDPTFYDVFSQAEIISLFKVPQATQVPFFIWNDHPGILQFIQHCRQAKEGDAFLDAAFSFFSDIVKSEWRVWEPERAVIHYVPLETGMTEDCKFNATLLEAAVEQIKQSGAWSAYNGTNFFWISSTYMNEIAESSVEKRAVSWDGTGNKEAPSEADYFRRSSATFFQAMNPHLRTCSGHIPFSPQFRFRNVRSYPQGELESYLYPGGHYRQVRAQRPFNLHFMGLADDREGYYSRVVALKALPGHFKPSILVRYRDMPRFKLPLCENELNLEGCQLSPDMSSDSGLFTRTLIQSKFGLHFRGDEWSSARFSDIVAAGALPIVVMREALDISTNGQCWIPWRNIAFYVSHSDFVTSPVESLQAILNQLTPLDLEKRFRLLHYYRPIFLHGLGSPIAAEHMITEFAASCLPEALLQAKNLTKVDMGCHFEQFMKVQQWQAVQDEDESAAAWSPTWLHALLAA